MVLIDTSVWIDFFNDSKSPSASFVQSHLEKNNAACINALIEMEILQGIRNNEQYTRVKLFLQDFQYLPSIPSHYFEKAIEIFRKCRAKGVTIRKSNDCLIAAHCLIDNLQIVHKDRDFDLIAKVFPDLNSIRIR